MRALRPLLLAVLTGAFALTSAPARAQDAETLTADDAWVTGNLKFLAYHEVGHLILDQVYKVDQVANRLAAEQTADDVSTWLLSPDQVDPDEDDYELIFAIEGWLTAAEEREDEGPWNNPHYPDDATRAARIACLLYGSDKSSSNDFADLQAVIELAFQPETCLQEYDKLNAALENVFGDTDITRGRPVSRVRIQYDDPGAALEEAADFLRNSQVLEDLRADLVESIGLPIDVTLRGAPCGSSVSGFQYSPSLKQITACYEEVDWFLFGDAPTSGAVGAVTGTAGDGLGSRPRQQKPLRLQAQPQPQQLRPPQQPRR
jgi:hypothetical protein